jgi:CPA2 family monovalent cation:H+ antiporter-2
MVSSLELIILLLACSVGMVAILRNFKMPPMIAYFVVGLILGPSVAGVIVDSAANHHLVEFGIVFLMFTIGLEFSLPTLNSMRQILFGIGLSQVAITLLFTIFIGSLFGLSLSEGFIIGSAITMSSTAIVSKILMERLDLNTRHGKLSIGILLFQDLAVILVLVLIPSLSNPDANFLNSFSLVIVKTAVLFSIIFKVGKPIMNYWFGIIARQKSSELFVLNVLLVTLSFSYLTYLSGLSYALGAFMAGMLISETHFRFQVESDIAPFRDILLGLFFITVGMMLNLTILIQYLFPIISLLIFLIVFKSVLITFLIRIFKYELGVGIRAGVILAHAGEFSFVILALAKQQDMLNDILLQIILSVSILSMLLAPFIIQINGKIARFLSKSYIKNDQKNIDNLEHIAEKFNDHVILCGFGRSGQYIARFLKEENIKYIAIDIDSNRVSDATIAGENVVYGDSSRYDVLKAAGIERAKGLMVAYSDDRASQKLLTAVREHNKNIPIIARTLDETSIDKLRMAGADEVVPEVLEGSLMLASHALVMFEVPLWRVIKKIREFRESKYKIFKGYFKGSTDFTEDLTNQQQLYSVEISKKSHIKGLMLKDIPFEVYGVQVHHLRRPNMLEDIQPRDDITLDRGDVIVLLGYVEEIKLFEIFAQNGR